MESQSEFPPITDTDNARPPPPKRQRLSASGLLSMFKPRQRPLSAPMSPASPLKEVVPDTDNHLNPTEPQPISNGNSTTVHLIDDDDDLLSNIDVASPLKLNPITPTRSLPPRAARTKVDYNNMPNSKAPKTASPKTATPRRKSKRQRAAENRLLDSDMFVEDTAPKRRAAAPRIVKADTVRNRVRDEIATVTKSKRDAFLVHHKDYFLPLLPPTNYISKLVQTQHQRQDFVPFTPMSEQPANLVATMKPYQLTGLSFLANMYENAMPAILGDEMGLGKTLQTLSLIQHLENTHPSPPDLARPYLVVCPLSVLGSWCDEARKWAPKLKVLRFHGTAAERNHVKSIATGTTDRYGNDTGRKKKTNASEPVTESRGTVFDVMVTTYEAFNAENVWIKQAFVWRYCILDEGHKIKNDKTAIALSLQGLKAEHRLLLTGTPLQNDMREMWALLHWLYPDVFIETTAELFKEAFDIGRGKVDSGFMDHARHLLELIMIRRMKNSPGVDLGLPTKSEVLLYIPLTPVQRFWYTRLLTKAGNTLLDDIFGNVKQKEEEAMIQEINEDAQLDQVDVLSKEKHAFTVQSRELIQQAIASEVTGEKDTSAYKRLMNIVMQLRKACITPYMIKGAAPEPYYFGEHIMHASGKFIVLNKLIDELVIKQRKKILIFSGFTSALDYCEDLLTTKGSNQHEAPFRHVRFDGSTARAVRNLQIRLFNDPASEYKIMLISTRAGGLGLNLTAASDVVFLDEDWNPQVTLQAESRSHRIGQTKPVTIYKLLSSGTVEEQMMGRIRKKLYLSAKITESMQDIHNTEHSSKRKRSAEQKDTSADDGPELGFSQLKSLIRRGATTLSHPEIDVNEMVTWDLETIIEKCKDKPIDPRVNGEAEDDVEKEWLAKMEKVESAVLDGVRYQKLVDKGEVAVPDLTRSDRREGKNTTVMVNGFAINKESMNCGNWEAVPTMAGKDPRLASPKREKAAPINHQEICQICFDGGEIYLCSTCPRVYHLDCMPKHYQAKATAKMNFNCSQHSCHDCEKNTSDAGGLVYRCRWCHRGYCEDCLDSNSKLLNDTLPEYEVLGFVTKRNAFYIHCHECLELEKDPATAKLIAGMAAQYDKEYEEFLQAQHASMAVESASAGALSSSSREESMTDGVVTLESSGLATPTTITAAIASAAVPVQKDRTHVLDLTADDDDDDDDDLVDLDGVKSENGFKVKAKKRKIH